MSLTFGSIYSGAGGMDALKRRIAAMGDAVCPPVAEWIGRRILQSRAERISA